MRGMPRTGLRAAIDRGEPHALHQRAHVIAAHRRAFPAQQVAEHPTAGEGILQVQDIQPAHEPQIGLRDAARRIVDRRP